MKKIKNIKISIESHEMLKTYCDKHGLKIYKFLEFMIKLKELKVYTFLIINTQIKKIKRYIYDFILNYY